jgi:imidazolonepropionase-like amidohydrolase
VEARQAGRDRTMARNLAAIHRAGVPVVLGTDAGNPLTLHGPSVFPELEAMQRAGMTPAAVLRAATADAADAMGRGADLGVIEAGRIADLLVLERDPGRDIANMRSILRVMRAGRLHARERLRP